jgi:hypothetical protein
MSVLEINQSFHCEGLASSILQNCACKGKSYLWSIPVGAGFNGGQQRDKFRGSKKLRTSERIYGNLLTNSSAGCKLTNNNIENCIEWENSIRQKLQKTYRLLRDKVHACVKNPPGAVC